MAELGTAETEASRGLIPEPKPNPNLPGGGSPRRAFVGLLLVVLIVAQAATAFALWNADRAIQRLEDRVAALDTGEEASPVLESPAVIDLGDGAASAAPPPPAALVGLPIYQGGADPAVGMNLGEVTGLEYYTQEQRTYRPDEGLARAYMVWAHWCPYCQQELPMVSTWERSNGADFPHVEIVSITTAMDPEASNPLLPYLESNRFAFPVLMDESGALASQFGVSAFPFWVLVAPDGTVLARTAGILGEEQMSRVFQRLEDLAQAS